MNKADDDTRCDCCGDHKALRYCEDCYGESSAFSAYLIGVAIIFAAIFVVFGSIHWIFR
jgi:hypothetical protein